MKIWTGTLMVFFFSISPYHPIIGQHFEWSDNLKFMDEAQIIHTTSRGEIVMGGRSMNYTFQPPGLIVLDSLGNVITKKYFDGVTFEMGTIIDMAEDSEGNIYLLGLGGLCDVCCQSSVQKYDPDWNPIFDFNNIPKGSGYSIKVEVIEGGHMLVLRDDGYMDLFDTYGELLLSFYLSQEPIHDIVSLDVNRQVLAGKGLYPSLFFGEFLDPVLTDNEFLKLEKTSNDWLLTQTFDNFFIINDTLGIEHQIDLTGNEIIDFGFTDLHISLLVKTDSNLIVLPLDYELNVLDTVIIEQKGTEIEGISMLNEKYILGGTETSRNRSMFAKSYNLEGKTIDYEMDASVISFDMPEMPFVIEFFDWGGRKIRMTNITVNIENQGNQAIENFRLNAYLGGFGITCYKEQTFFETYNIPLEPGESTTLFIPQIDFTVNQIPDPFEFCFWTSIPNNKIDQNHENDSFCASFLINNVEALVENSLINIYPNPASEFIQIDFQDSMSGTINLEIYDYEGKLIQKKSYINSYDKTLDITHLPKGLYFISIHPEGINHISKFIKK